MRFSVSVPKFYFIYTNIRLIPVSKISTIVQPHVSGTVKRLGPIFGMVSPTNSSYFYHELALLQPLNVDQGKRMKWAQDHTIPLCLCPDIVVFSDQSLFRCLSLVQQTDILL